MARRRDRQPNQRKAYSEHHQRVEAYTQEVNRLFDEMVAQAVHLVGIFEGMEDTPALEHALQGLKKTFAERMLANISLGMMNEWSAASRVQDELLRRVLGERFPEKYTLNYPQALEAFLKRKTAGLSLSQRIWKLAGQAEEELTTAIAVGLSDGLSAHELSREVRKYLQDPDKLFRRVRDDEGDLKLSKPAKAYRPGQGVYRSSHKNALRLTRTEINMAYRRGEQSRWQDMDFVVGYEVKRSGTGYPCPVCEALAGKYPKDFVWSTWHPHCRCYAIPILKTEDELFEDSDKPSINEVKEPHEGFQRWVKEQKPRIVQYYERDTLPLFLKENKQALRLLKGEKWSNSKTPSLLERAKARQAKRTPQQIEDIKKRWEKRAKVRKYITELPDNLTYEQKRAIALNNIELEGYLGIRKGKPMSYEDANQGSENPKYNQGIWGYKVNCQTCTVTHLLRRRGFQVEALPNIKNSAFDLMKKKGITWQERFLNQDDSKPDFNHIISWASRNNLKTIKEKDLRRFLRENMIDDGIYEVYCGWKRSKSAHVFCAEVVDGRVKFFDPQTGNSDVAMYLSKMNPKNVAVTRIDNKIVNPKIMELFLAKI